MTSPIVVNEFAICWPGWPQSFTVSVENTITGLPWPTMKSCQKVLIGKGTREYSIRR